MGGLDLAGCGESPQGDVPVDNRPGGSAAGPSGPPARAGADAAASPGPRYRGYVGTLNANRGQVGPDASRGQGAYHGLLFVDRLRRRTVYRACLRHVAGHASRCWTRTAPAGVSEIDASIYINGSGGPGRWQATWSVAGRPASRFSFHLAPEFGD